MSSHPHLNNAPIQEALIDIRVVLPADFDVEVFRPVGERVMGFARVEEAHKVHAEVELERPSIKSDITTRGLYFFSEDGRRVAQLRTDGFTFNWLKPYNTWDDLFGQARELWNEYAALADPEEVTRVGLRYVNRFPVVLPVDLDEVFQISLDLPPGIDGMVADFLYRVTFRESEVGHGCNLTLTGERRSTPDEADIIFDIDCFDGRGRRLSGPVIWDEILPELHVLKNRVFFSGLTEEWIETFK